MQRRSGSRRAWVVAMVAVALTLGVQARAQTSPSNQNRTVNVNYVYAADLGFGGYSLSGLTTDVYTLPFAYTLPAMPYNGWALRLMAPLQLGIYSLNATDTNGQRIAVTQQSISAVPGVELQIPLGSRTVLKPFAQGGVGHAFGTGAGNPDAWIYLTGARAVTQWQVGDYTLSLGNGAIYAGDSTIGPGFGEHYISLQVGGEVRRPLGFKIGQWMPDLGIYVGEYYYPAPLQFSRFLNSPLQVSNQTEIGFSVGAATPFQILWLSNARIGAGFVFGGGLDVWHINFGFPF